MIYLDYGATSFRKPPQVLRSVEWAIAECASPGRGGYAPAMEAARVVFDCRSAAADLLGCRPEQVVFTSNCTQGLNLAIRSLVQPGSRVVISGFEHNAVTRPLHLLKAEVTVAGRKLFDWEDTLSEFEKALKKGQDAAVFTQVSNVFGYILPVDALAGLCRSYGVPFIVDVAQGAGSVEVNAQRWGADFVAAPGHKGLLGPQGTGILICRRQPRVFFAGGTGSQSESPEMPPDLPERMEAGTANVPGIAGLLAGIRYVKSRGVEKIFASETMAAKACIDGLRHLPVQVFAGPHQGATVSFVPDMDCEVLAERLGRAGIAVRAGLHCAPLAHASGGTLKTGTVRVSFGLDSCPAHAQILCRQLQKNLNPS